MRTVVGGGGRDTHDGHENSPILVFFSNLLGDREEFDMTIATSWFRITASLTTSLAVGMLLTACQGEPTPAQVDLDADDIGGVVTSGSGPEAGVWVIAETDDFETRFARIVVTDDQVRYLVPDLPDADYTMWVRGYGLVDSAKVDASPGSTVDLTAVVAPDAASAAQIYPAAYWYSMMHLPEDSEVADLPGGRNDEEHGLRRLSSTGAGIYTYHPRPAGHVRLLRGCLAPAPSIGASRREHGCAGDSAPERRALEVPG